MEVLGGGKWSFSGEAGAIAALLGAAVKGPELLSEKDFESSFWGLRPTEC